jgi:recombination protein RecT
MSNKELQVSNETPYKTTAHVKKLTAVTGSEQAAHKARLEISHLLRRNPKLDAAYKKDPEQLFASCVRILDLGLSLNPARQEVTIIPYADDIQVIIMYQGLLKIARDSGAISEIFAEVVKEQDEFTLVYSTENPLLEHRPAITTDRGKTVGAYAIAKIIDGGYQYTYLDTADINNIAGNKLQKSGPWRDYYDEMAKKTALRRLFKLLPRRGMVDKAADLIVEEEKREVRTSRQPVEAEPIK